jgi:hypothetical protein
LTADHLNVVLIGLLFRPLHPVLFEMCQQLIEAMPTIATGAT